MTVIKVAAGQISPVRYSREGTVDKVVQKIQSTVSIYWRRVTAQLGVRSLPHGESAENTEVLKVRAAFRSCRVVRNRNESLWR